MLPLESAASGLMAGVNAGRLVRGKNPLVFPPETAHGALSNYITTCDRKHFQPMNVNFGIMAPLGERIKNKKLKKERLAERALSVLDGFKGQID